MNFLVVYIREVEALAPGKPIRMTNGRVLMPAARTPGQRRKQILAGAKLLDLDLPLLADTMDNDAEKAYGAYPNRAYIVNTAGHVAYKGMPHAREFEVAGIGHHFAPAPRCWREIGERGRMTSVRLRRPAFVLTSATGHVHGHVHERALREGMFFRGAKEDVVFRQAKDSIAQSAGSSLNSMSLNVTSIGPMLPCSCKAMIPLCGILKS